VKQAGLWQALAMEISLTPELQKIVEENVKSGVYQDASEFIRDALRRVWVDPNVDSAALEEMLLEGVNSPAIPWNKETMESIRREALSNQ
jgi:putative addiction module CopG family antidote